jgi:hypothetical protein
MAFNIYKWRRNQLLTEGEVTENKAQKVYDTIEKFLDPKYTDNMGKSAVISAISRGLFLEENLNENEVKVSNVEFVAGDLYPSNLHLGSSERFQTKEKFEVWREKFKKMYGDIELKKGPAGWKPIDSTIQ